MKRKLRAIMLVELLVVIGIIALLISILLPSLAKARAAAVTIKCMANLRSIGQALVIYQNDNHGTYPVGYFQNKATGTSYDWRLAIADLMTGTTAQDSSMWNRANNRKLDKVFACPAAPLRPDSWVTGAGYAGHPRIFPWVSSNPADGRPYYQYKQVWLKDPSIAMIVFDTQISLTNAAATIGEGFSFPEATHLDGGMMTWGAGGPGLASEKLDAYAAANSSWFHTDDPIFDVYSGGVSTCDYDEPNPRSANGWWALRTRHGVGPGGAANVLFADGHVESFQKTGSGASSRIGLTHRNSFVPCVHVPGFPF